jgi:hypothetical protein
MLHNDQVGYRLVRVQSSSKSQWQIRALHDFYVPVCKERVKNVASARGPLSRFIIADDAREGGGVLDGLQPRTGIAGQRTLFKPTYLVRMLNRTEKSKTQFEEVLDAPGCAVLSFSFLVSSKY